MSFHWDIPPEKTFADLYDDYAKNIIRGIQQLAKVYAVEIEAFGACFGTADFKEGTTAFLEKRKADFPGE